MTGELLIKSLDCMGLSYTAPPLKRNTVPVFVNDEQQDGASSVHCVDDLDSVALRLLDLVLLDSQQALPLLISHPLHGIFGSLLA